MKSPRDDIGVEGPLRPHPATMWLNVMPNDSQKSFMVPSHDRVSNVMLIESSSDRDFQET